MWSIDFLPDPMATSSVRHKHDETSHIQTSSFLLLASQPLEHFFGSLSLHQIVADDSAPLYRDLQSGGRGAQVALADFCARRFLSFQNQGKNRRTHDNGASTGRTLGIELETLDNVLFQAKGKQSKKNRHCGPRTHSPYVVERSDFYCHEDQLHVMLRMNVVMKTPGTRAQGPIDQVPEFCKGDCQNLLMDVLMDDRNPKFLHSLIQHVASVVLQQRVRAVLSKMDAVAFLCNGSVLPRKSGTSDAPMASPPAVPFMAPSDSPMSKSINVDLGPLAKYLADSTANNKFSFEGTTVTLSGLVIPGGITLICGGGYHGKSTTLQAISFGIYDKIPGDGREWCVSVASAVSVRAEDGRYVHNCNISAFISNLPTPPGVQNVMDTQHFSTKDASGSTSQATNVVETIELGATAMLVDEDISAANFMARDGRMRALVMDESITPLLYRVNGLYNTHKISFVVVVGGVGDWLDVPHNVLLLDKYVAHDATKKARSISYQFSYGHVQYAGRGVVHRLEWEMSGTPTPRRPIDAFCRKLRSDVVISLLDGGHALSLHRDADGEEDENSVELIDDDDEGCVDASRIVQFLSRRQLYGAGICIAWLLQHAPNHPDLGLQHLLQQLDSRLDDKGMKGVLDELKETSNGSLLSKSWVHMLESTGFVERPRCFEIGQLLTRLHGIEMEDVPVYDDGSGDAARREEDQTKKALAELWAKRRSNKNNAQ